METDSVEDLEVNSGVAGGATPGAPASGAANQSAGSGLLGSGCPIAVKSEPGTPVTPSGAANRGRKHPFFQRSNSTLCLGCAPPDPFELPLAQALPLADQPHLLQPNARREELFGIPKQPITVPSTGEFGSLLLAAVP